MSGAKLINRLRRNLRGSIITAFSVLLFISYLLVSVLFNVALNQYIRRNAIAELAVTQELYAYMGHFIPVVRSGLFGQRINHFYLNSYFEMHYGYISPATDEIGDTLRRRSLHPAFINNRHLSTDNGKFYVTAQQVYWDGEVEWYAIFYVDITDISRFSKRINILLATVVLIIGAMALLIATFLAGSLSHPLRVLNNFARQIGLGDFSPNPEQFANEEFETLNQSLNYTAKQLAKYDNDQKTFFQNVSHELRTPLMSIKSYAEGIKYGIMDAKNASDTILEATNRLTGMVGEILYVSRIDNITAPMEDEVDLRMLVTDRIRIHEDPANKIIMHYRHDNEPVVIHCIKPYIERVMDNLISNAMRYAHSKIEIECFGVGPKAIIRVIDDGPGFEPEALNRVFERFYHGKNGLTGIGLAIVKSIVEQHQGTALAENKEKGAALTISLPRA
jgi:signal transduction histidine kinase